VRVALVSLVSTSLLFLAPTLAHATTVGSGACVTTVDTSTGVSAFSSGNKCYITFSSVDTHTWTAPSSVSTISLFIVGGGGAGGAGAWGGGGGAGGLVYDANYAVTPGASYSLVVGRGGTVGAASLTPSLNRSNNGTNSWFSTSAYAALGGGAGGVNYSLLGGGGAGAGGGGFLGSTAGNYLKTGLGGLQLLGGLQSYEAGQQRLGQQQQYAKQLQALMANPSSVQGLPGYQAGLQAVQRSQAAQGYQGSGNMAAALAGYGGQAYQQQLANLSALQGQSAPVSSPMASLTGAGLGAYGLGSGLSALGYI